MSDNHTGKQIEFAARALKMPAIRRCWAELAERARTDNWTHEQYLAAILDRQVSEREANGTVLRISGARFPAVKTLEDFNFDHLPGDGAQETSPGVLTEIPHPWAAPTVAS
ncbi:ATP-binding protein, partial [Gordonia sp. YY1]|uniref:ATP-binding protein n=1 Tax=Gordonia sp. YY1 TaxID=396712 RepID=UPI001F438D23